MKHLLSLFTFLILMSNWALAQETKPKSSIPDPDVAVTLKVRPALQAFITSHNIPKVMGVAIDMSQKVAVLDVTADDGTPIIDGMSSTDAAQVERALRGAGLSDPASPTGMSYQGVPVEVSTIQTVDATGPFVDWHN